MRFNQLGVAEIMAEIEDPLRTEVAPGYTEAEISRSQHRGGGIHPRWSVDRKLLAVCIRVWPESVMKVVLRSAKLLPSRKAKLLAFLRHSGRVSAVRCDIEEEADAMVSNLWEWQRRFVSAHAYRQSAEYIFDWARTGDPVYLTFVGLPLNKLPSFDAPFGAVKKHCSAPFALVTRAFLDGEPWTETMCSVLVAVRNRCH